MSDLALPPGYASSPDRPESPAGANPDLPAAECLCAVTAHRWVNDEYKLLAVKAPAKALTVAAGQFFQMLCPSPDGAEVWTRRPMSMYAVDRAAGQVEFLYKIVGRGTRGLARLEPGDELNIAGPFGVGFALEPGWKRIAVIGRGVGLATLAPISALAAGRGVGATVILSARTPDLLMSGDLFERMGAEVINVTDVEGTSAVEKVESILEARIATGRIDAFFTCGSNRLLGLVKRLGKKHGIPGQVAMEQVMACGLGPCYICVRTFEVNGERVLRRVCREGPVFDIQEATGW